LRAGRGEEAFAEAGGGFEGLHAKKRQYKGELPRLDYKGFEHFTREAGVALVNEIEESSLRAFEKTRAQEAIENALAGRLPTKSQVALLEKVFPPEVVKKVEAAATRWEHLKLIGYDILGLPRALEASFDLSAPFRQGLVAGARHPVMFAKNFKPMLKAAASREGYDAILEGIHTRPTYERMMDAGLQITEVDSLTEMEERYMSRLVGKLPGVSHSARAYTGFLDKMRADMFDRLLPEVEAAAKAEGRDADKAVKDLARYINASTGRGGLGGLEQHAVLFNQLLFSPRLLASRLSFLNPV